MGHESGLLRLGLIADIQYSDADDGTDFSGTEHRHFRNSLEIARNAVGVWNAAGVDAVVQLGDIIDGINAKQGASTTALRTVLDVLNTCKTPLGRFDLIGNHELYNVQRSELAKSGLRCMDDAGNTYYSKTLNSRWEAIFLDPYEEALIGVSTDDPSYKRATTLMNTHNPKVLSGAGGDWFEGLPESLHRYVPYNGAVSSKQLQWLESALQSAEAQNRSVLVFTHVPLLQSATKPKTVVWNAEEVLAILHAHGNCVVAVIAGHDHDGGYATDARGLHHITMNSPLTATPGNDCFAILECHDDGFAQFRGFGRACVESESQGEGRAYAALTLAKGFQNEPSLPRANASVSNSEALGQLVSMGFPEAKVKAALARCDGSVEAASAILCEA
eukprot:TRINITY_DN63533_c0_g1_i1.p1 TRINITY_DN63533_c0_g1~~TRINITY_DN63533_c0_g1_i1.p1  ORF type:complete len:405 (+),score=36.06 TRINITY_DN63533_c0_g1_i1:53-1216(+)